MSSKINLKVIQVHTTHHQSEINHQNSIHIHEKSRSHSHIEHSAANLNKHFDVSVMKHPDGNANKHSENNNSQHDNFHNKSTDNNIIKLSESGVKKILHEHNNNNHMDNVLDGNVNAKGQNNSAEVAEVRGETDEEFSAEEMKDAEY